MAAKFSEVASAAGFSAVAATVAARRAWLGASVSVLVLGLATAPVLAASPVLPTGGQFLAGAGVIGTAVNGSLKIVQSSGRGIIDWTSFSIGQGGSVSINNGAGATLNKVTGGQLSRIDGSLTATGSIFFVNPQGIVVGSTGKVLGGGAVVLSTRDISNQSFLAGGSLTASGTSAGDVTNLGRIVSRQGDVILIGRSVTNTGSIEATHGVADLAAADQVLMSTVGGVDGVYVASDTEAKGDVTQSGRIKAAAAKLSSAGGSVYTLAGNRSGLIQASGTATIGGQIWLTAPNGTVRAAGSALARNADGSGGKIVASGRDVAVLGTAVLSATGARGGEILVGVTAPQTALAQSTTIADGAQILAGGPAGGGSIETSGHSLSLGSATVTAGKGGQWLTDPTDLTLGAPAAAAIVASLNSGTNVTEQTTASTVSDPSGAGTTAAGAGDIIVAAPISWTGTGSLTLNAFHTATINAQISGAAGGFNVTAGAAIVVGAPVSASVVKLVATGGSISIGAAGSVAGTTGATLATSANFINSAGAGAVSSSGGRWLIYSTTPGANTLGGLTPNFIQYATAYPTAPTPVTGNGLLYTASEAITLTLKGTISKVYDGTTAVSIAPANFTATGLLGGDTVVSATGAYATPDVAVGLNVATTGATGLTVINGAATVYNFTNNATNANIGAVTPKTLTAAIVGNPTKIYDQTTTATLTAANYQINGIVSGTLTVGQPSSVAYASSNAGSNIAVNATFGPTNFTAGGGLKLIDYTLPTAATGLGAINPAPLLITGVRATNKTYDRTTTDTLAGTAALFGVLPGDTVSLSSAGASGVFASSNAGTGIVVTGAGFTISGASAPNYALTQPLGLAANITPASLSLTGITANNKLYDGGTVASLNTVGTLNGVIAGDTVGYSAGSATGAFVHADVGVGLAVSTAGFTLNGVSAANYSLAQPSGLTANITPVTLTAAITATPTKVYDGSTKAYLASNGFTIFGLVNGETASINQVASLDYASANAGSQSITANLQPPDFVGLGGTKLTNYILPTSAVGTGTITQAPITAQIIGTPTKTYDATSTATLTGANYRLQGFVVGEGASVGQTAGTYASPNTGPELVTATLIGFLVANGGTLLSNYSFPTTASGQGLINAAHLTEGTPPGGPYNINGAVINVASKVYDGTTTLTGLTSANFTLTGFQGGDAATVTKTTGTYGAADAGIEPITVLTAVADYSFSSGMASNYVLPTALYGTGAITPAPVTVTIVNNPTKVYNNSTRSVLTGVNLGTNSGTGSFLFTGFVGADGVSLTSPILGAYATAAAGSNINVTASFNGVNLTALSALPATNLANYTLPTSASGPGTIAQAPLYVSNVTAQNKVYNTTTAATLNLGAASTFGLVQGDTVTLASNTAAATFATANAGSNLAVTATGFSISGGASANYTLIQPVGLNANITRAPLSLTGTTAFNKVYDNTAVATVNTGGSSLVGVFATDAANVTLDASAYTASFSSKNVGTALPVTVSGLGLLGTAASNYALGQPANLSGNITPAPIVETIIGTPTKIYDGSSSTTLTAANYTLTGFIAGSGDGATVPQSATANYASTQSTIGTPGVASPNVVSGVFVNSTLVPSDFAATGGTNLSNYALPTFGTGGGQITPVTIMGMIIGNPTKVYDTTTTASNLTTANYTLTGFVGAQSATVTQTMGSYASANAGANDLITVSGLTPANYNAGGGTILSNYVLPVVLIGPGTITPAPLTIAGVTATNKIYDRTTADTLGVGGATLVGTKGADVLTLGTAGATGTFASANVGTGISVSTAGFTFGGVQSANYTLTQPGPLSANITLRTISLASVTKIYDGTTSATSTAANYLLTQGGLNGVVAGDTVSAISTDPTDLYASKNVANGINVTLASLSLTGAAAGNYLLPSTVTNAPIGFITPKTLTATIINNPTKPYDNTVAAALTTNNYGLGGFIVGEGGDVTVTKTTGAYATANASSPDLVTTSLNAGNFAAVTTALSNYILPVTASGAGTIQPLILNATIVNTPTKTYDSNSTSVLTGSNYNLSGFLSGQGASVTQTSGSYASSHASQMDLVTASLASGNFTANGGTLLSNYVLPVTASGNGVINQATIMASLTGVTKPYDATTNATLAPVNYTLSGFVSGQGASVSQTVGTYASPNASLSDLVTASLTAGNFTATGGTMLSDYILPATASGLGAITPLTLMATIVNTPTKIYDATTGAVLTTSNFGLTGFLSGQGGDVTVNQTAGTYASANAGTTDLVTAGLGAGNFNATSTNLANYVLPTTANGNGVIKPAPITATIVLTPTKPYDTTTSATLASNNYALSGFIGMDAASVTQTAGVYASPNASNPDLVTASLTAGNFTPVGATLLSNYALPTAAAGNGAIQPLILTATIVGPPTKTYDSTTGSVLTPANYALGGFIGGQGATVSQTVGTYASPNASQTDAVTASLAAGNFSGTGGTFLSNYVLPTNAVGNGIINPAQLVALIVGTPTKPYDTTTSATLTPANYTVGGFFGGDSATVHQTAGTYASPNASPTDLVTASLSAANLTAGGATNFSNYILPTSASGNGAITPLTLTATIVNTPTKTYDATTNSTLTPTNYALSGFIGGQGSDVTVTQTAGVYASPNVSATDTVTASIAAGNLAASTTNLGNYVLPTSASGNGVINPARLTAAIIGNPTKTYDGGANASLTPNNYVLTGFFGGQGASVNQPAGTYASPNAGSPELVTASLGGGAFTGSNGTALSNYILPISASGAGAINPAPLTVGIVGTPTRPYNGTTNANLTSANYTIGGFVSGQSGTVTTTSGIYGSPNASATDPITVALTSGSFTFGGGALASNYSFPSSTTGIGAITPLTLTATIVGTPTKRYDGSTGATLVPANFVLSGFILGQGATVTATSGTYASAAVGSETVTTRTLTGPDFSATNGTVLANYVLPTGASGAGLIINNFASLGLPSTLTTLLIQRGASLPDAARLSREATFSIATPRLFIPYPAPGDLSTRRGNAFGTMPIVTEAFPDGCDQVNLVQCVKSGDSAIDVYSGPPVINATEEILLQGGAAKHWTITLPPARPDAASLGAQ